MAVIRLGWETTGYCRPGLVLVDRDRAASETATTASPEPGQAALMVPYRDQKLDGISHGKGEMQRMEPPLCGSQTLAGPGGVTPGDLPSMPSP
jgi:hypothetical protein